MSATGTVDEVVVSAEVSTGWVVADPLPPPPPPESSLIFFRMKSPSSAVTTTRTTVTPVDVPPGRAGVRLGDERR
jgi:hypothetical protein